MDNFEYYEVIEDGGVFVRERSCEFFALYSPVTKKWCQPDDITFMELTHDRDYRIITKEDALLKTDGDALSTLYREYVALIEGNRSV